MLKRNRYLVDHAACLLAVYNGERRGGTAMTVRYARKVRREIMITNPIPKDTEHDHNLQISDTQEGDNQTIL